MGDRYFWAWGLTDFGNATFQGIAHGLSRLWTSGLWPFESSEKNFIKRINSLFTGAKNLTRSNGSLEEAFPNEGSYCVTALVAFDFLVTLDLLSDKISNTQRNNYIEIIRPFIAFLINNDENHAIISNHLATAVAALLRWDLLIGGDKKAANKADILLARILKNQSKEGWFKEYEGLDPGYQTLCIHYLSDVHLIRPDLNLLEKISRSVRFLEFFAHPDGSFGGHYGSRCTRFYYPSGILALADEIPESIGLSTYLQNSISENRVVGLSSMDESNLIPMFNSYAWAASLSQNRNQGIIENGSGLLPFESKQPFRRNFNDAGLLIDRGHKHYSIINYKKGGVTYHFAGNKLAHIDTGVILESPKGKLGSNQIYDKNLNVIFTNNSIQIHNRFAEMPKKKTSPFKFLILRLLCISIFRFSSIRNLAKRLLVKYLITEPRLWPIWNVRVIKLGEDLKIIDQSDFKSGFNKVKLTGPFTPIHMASQGYWQVQDEFQDAS